MTDYLKTFWTLIIVGLCACGQKSKSLNDKVTVDLEKVDSITIKRHQEINHTIVHKPIRLTDTQVKTIIEKWNNADSKGLCKFLPEYEMTIYTSDKKIRNFRINSKSIKEDNDWCYDLADNDFVINLLEAD
jgi:type IV pilus biogenesis protein CpaD/CtpE